MNFPSEVLDAADRAIAATVTAGEVGDGGVGKPEEPLRRFEVATALLFLTAGPVRELRAPCRGETSYTWKHRAEKWGRLLGFAPYVSNGAFIAAADWLGIPSRRFPGSPNVNYALAFLRNREYARYDDATWEREREAHRFMAHLKRTGRAP